MTEPIKPRNDVKFGGVEFNSNDVVKREKIIKENGGIRYSVFLKNGVHIEYPQQKNSNNAYVEMNYSEPENRRNKSSQKRPLATTFISNLAFGKIEGSKNNYDDIILTGGNSNIIDISNDNQKDAVYIRPGVVTPSLNNKVVMDKNDRTDINREKTLSFSEHEEDIVVEGEGIADENSHKKIL